MSRRFGIVCCALVAAVSARGQTDIQIGDLDPPALDGLKGAGGCAAYHLEDSCQYVLGYVLNGAATVVVLKEFQGRLASGEGQWLIVDVVEVPAQFSGRLKSNDCRYGGATTHALVAAIDAAGEPGEWVGPAEWVVVVDWNEKKLVGGDPRLVECWISPLSA